MNSKTTSKPATRANASVEKLRKAIVGAALALAAVILAAGLYYTTRSGAPVAARRPRKTSAGTGFARAAPGPCTNAHSGSVAPFSRTMSRQTSIV